MEGCSARLLKGVDEARNDLLPNSVRSVLGDVAAGRIRRLLGDRQQHVRCARQHGRVDQLTQRALCGRAIRAVGALVRVVVVVVVVLVGGHSRLVLVVFVVVPGFARLLVIVIGALGGLL